MGFLKVLKQPVQNIENIWKYDFKWTRYLIAIFIVSFDLYQYILATSLEKWKTNFPRMYFWSTLCCHYKISNILLNHQTFLTRNSEISVRWFLLKSMLKQKWAQGWQGKRKQMGSILLRYQPSVTCNSRTALKSTFDFTEIVNEWKWKWRTVCHYVRFISQLSQERHIQILKCFHSELICSVTSDYHEKNEVKDFLAQNFRLSCISDFRKIPPIWVASQKHLWRNSFLKKVADLSPATLLRIEFLCISFSRVFLE